MGRPRTGLLDGLIFIRRLFASELETADTRGLDRDESSSNR